MALARMGMALVTKYVMTTFPRRQTQCNISHSFYSRRLMWKLGEDGVLQCIGGEWVYCTRSEAFKHKARLQPHSKNFNFVMLLNSFICKILKYEASFILKLKVVCICYACLGDESLFM